MYHNSSSWPLQTIFKYNEAISDYNLRVIWVVCEWTNHEDIFFSFLLLLMEEKKVTKSKLYY